MLNKFMCEYRRGEILVPGAVACFRHHVHHRGVPVPILMTISQFQQKFGVSRSTVYRLRDRNVIPFVHIGRAVRIRTEDANNWYQSLSDAAGSA